MTSSITKYDKQLLLKICDRDNCIINFDNIHKYNREIKINFICNCGNEYIKIFRGIYEKSGAYCKICTEITRNEKKNKLV